MEPADRSCPFTIARVVRTRGNKGEVLAELHTDFPTRFDGLEMVWLEFAGGQRQRLRIEHSWEYRGRRVIKFEGVGSISAAERLVGAWIQVEAAEAVPLPCDTYFDHDLVGCELRSGSGDFFGTVTAVLHLAGNNLLAVQGSRGEFLVPATKAILRAVDLGRRQIVADLPDGLMDLNG